jgi:hypothetical protein
VNRPWEIGVAAGNVMSKLSSLLIRDGVVVAHCCGTTCIEKPVTVCPPSVSVGFQYAVAPVPATWTVYGTVTDPAASADEAGPNRHASRTGAARRTAHA